MIGDVLDVIALGRKLIETIGNLRRDVQSARAVQPEQERRFRARRDSWRTGSARSNREPRSTTIAWRSWSKAWKTRCGPPKRSRNA